MEPVNPTSPISQLPVELLRQIFEDYLDLPLHRLWPPHPRTFRHYQVQAAELVERVDRPLELRAVCPFWKAIVESTPTLWRCHHLIGNPGKIPHQLEFLAKRISWSGDVLPLSLYISWRSGQEDKAMQSIVDLVIFLDKWQGRWHHLHLDVPQAFFDRLTAPRKIIFPSLQVLSLAHDIQITDSLELVGRSHFPDLAVFHSYDEALDIDQPSQAIPWANLTIVDIDSFFVWEVLYILNEAQRLKHFRVGDTLTTFDDEVDHASRVNGGRPIQHTSLETLEIVNKWNQDPFGPILCRLETPSLKQLRCSSREFRHSAVFIAIKPLLAKTASSQLHSVILVQGKKTAPLSKMSESIQLELPIESAHVFLIDDHAGYAQLPALWGDVGDVCPECFVEVVDSKHSCPVSLIRITPCDK